MTHPVAVTLAGVANVFVVDGFSRSVSTRVSLVSPFRVGTTAALLTVS